jgi:hypothetical protein
MFAGHRTAELGTNGEFRSPAVETLRILSDAGYDLADEKEMQGAILAYNSALLVWRATRQERRLQASPTAAQKARAGRNDPCPCGSGRKFKKCCLDQDRGISAGNSGSPGELGPEIVPRLFDRDAAFEDIERLSRIMDRDPAFANVGFTGADISAFMEKVRKSEPALFEALQSGDPETSASALDDLSILFRREYGRRDFGRSVITDKCLETAKRVTSSDELRALAAGICFALMGEVLNDPADDVLADLLFRKALFGAIGNVSIFKKILDRFGGDEEELCRLIAENDPSVAAKIQAVADGLSASEADLLRRDFDKGHKNLWDTIQADEFPVPLPFASQLALVGQLTAAVSGDDAASMDQVSELVGRFSDELMEEDYAVYGQMLEGWLKTSEEQPYRIVEAVKTMRHLCMGRMIEEFAPKLFIRCFNGDWWGVFDEEEQKFVDGLGDDKGIPALVVEYDAWLRAKGYHGLAERLVRSWEGVDVSRARPPVRESEVA